MRKLTIDEGNSSTKIGLWEGDRLVSVVSGRRTPLEMVGEVLRQGDMADIAIVCSVCRRDPQVIKTLLEPMARKVIVLSAQTPLPIELRYETPGTLGADRIAAACGAAVLAPGQTALVVDMGTAITYDVLENGHTFVGGNIAPGIFVRLEALNHFTKALPLIETDGDVPRWGYDTATALRSGAIRGVVGELQYYRHCLMASPSAFPKPKVFLTGGSANLITPFITSEIIEEPNLVLIGLNSIINHNEK